MHIIILFFYIFLPSYANTIPDAEIIPTISAADEDHSMQQQNIMEHEAPKKLSESKTYPDFSQNIESLAQQRYKDALLFKKTRSKKYAALAKNLPSKIQELLVDLHTPGKGVHSSNFQDVSPETRQLLADEIRKLDNANKSSFFSKQYSGHLMDDLQTIAKNLISRKNVHAIPKTTSVKIASWQDFAQAHQAIKEQQAVQDEHDRQARALERQMARAGTMSDYLDTSAFTDLTKPTVTIDAQSVHDPKVTVSTQQIDFLQKKLTTLKKNKNDASESEEQEINTKIDLINQEIVKIKNELIVHHQKLADDLSQHLTKLNHSKNEVSHPSYIYNRTVTFANGNRFGSLHDLGKKIESLSEILQANQEQEQNLQKELSAYKRQINSNTQRIKEITDKITTLHNTIADLQEKIQTTKQLLKQGRFNRFKAIQSTEGIVEAALKSSGANLQEEQSDLETKFTTIQKSIDSNVSAVQTLKLQNRDLEARHQQTETQYATTHDKVEKLRKQKQRYQDWFNTEKQSFASEQKTHLERLDEDIHKAQVAHDYHQYQATIAAQP